MWKLVNHEAKPHVPPGEKLPDDEIEQLTYRRRGRDMRLTDVHGNVITEVLS